MTATAGEFVVYSCATPDDRPAPIDGWWSTNGLSHSGPIDQCASRGGMVAYMGSDDKVFTHWWSAGQHGIWRLSGYSVRRLELYRSVRTGAGRAADLDHGVPYSWIQNGLGTVLEDCSRKIGCYELGSTANHNAPENRVVVANPSAGALLTVGCGGPYGACAPSYGTPRIETRIYRAEVTIGDDASPSLPEFKGGTALASEPLAGVRSLTLKATDSGMGGVYEVVVTIGGREVVRRVLDDNRGKCVDAGAAATRYEFVHINPCPYSVEGTLYVDTRQAPEGSQTLELRVYDAAGNSTAVERTVTIDNVPLPSVVRPPSLNVTAADDVRRGDTLRLDEGQWDGPGVTRSIRWQRGDGQTWVDIEGATGLTYQLSRADEGSRVRAVVTARNSEGSVQAQTAATPVIKTGATIVGQTIEPGPGDGAANGAGGDLGSAQLVVDREQRSIDVRYGTKIVVTGRLVDGQGRPIGGAEVDVYEQLVTSAAPWSKVVTIKTDDQGGYAYRPKTTASRRLRFAYAAQRGAADYRATRDVLVSVAAGMTARAERRLVRGGGLLKLRGRVTLEGLPKSGSWVDVQVLDGGVWRTVGARRASSRGLWTFKHRLRHSRGVTFRFRALLRTAADLPSSQATSPTVKVRVR